MIDATAVGPSAYWYLTRGTGTVALILLSLSVALGIANSRRLRTERFPRFVVDAVHRTVSLLALAFTAIHVVTSLLDGFAPIRVVDAFVPFVSAYRPLWVGFGAVALDLLLAVVITSLLRRQLGYRAWRVTHWTAYGSWPVAMLHTFGTGSDAKIGWMLAIAAVCVIVVIAAVVVRALAGWPDHASPRLAAILVCATFALGLIIWLPGGPLAKGWARRAGTPSYLLASASAHTSGPSGVTHANATASSFTASANGTVREGQSGNGLAVVEISASLHHQRLSVLDIRITGQPLGGGGVQMTSSSVTLGTAGAPREFQGALTALEGTNLTAELRNSGGQALTLTAQLQLHPGNGALSGTVHVAPVGG